MPEVKNNIILNKSSQIIEVGRPMPIIPEMRAIWDSLRDQYQALLNGMVTPEIAANKAQKNSLSQIKVMNEVVKPGGEVFFKDYSNSVNYIFNYIFI